MALTRNQFFEQFAQTHSTPEFVRAIDALIIAGSRPVTELPLLAGNAESTATIEAEPLKVQTGQIILNRKTRSSKPDVTARTYPQLVLKSQCINQTVEVPEAGVRIDDYYHQTLLHGVVELRVITIDPIDTVLDCERNVGFTVFVDNPGSDQEIISSRPYAYSPLEDVYNRRGFRDQITQLADQVLELGSGQLVV